MEVVFKVEEVELNDEQFCDFVCEFKVLVILVKCNVMLILVVIVVLIMLGLID